MEGGPQRETPGAGGESRLRREIGFTGLLAFSVGINIGAGLFVLVNVAAGLTGPSVTLAMLIAAVPALLALVPYTMLACGLPTTTGTYRYAKLLNPSVGFVVAVVLIFGVLVGGQPLFARVAGEYLGELLPVAPLLIGVVSLVLFWMVNLLGVRPTAVIQITLMVALFAAIAVFVVGGAPQVDGELFSPFLDGGVPGLLAAAGLLFALMAGGLGIVDVGEEVIDPERLYKRVLPLGMLIVLAIYVAITVIAAGTVPGAAMEDETLIVVAEEFLGSFALGFFIVAGAAVAGLTTLNVVYALIARGLLVVSSEGLIPRAFSHVDPRSGSPTVGLTFTFLVALVVLLLQPSTQFLGAILNIGLVLAVGTVALAASRVPDRYPGIVERSNLNVSRGVLRAACFAVVGFNGLILLLLIAATPAAAAASLVAGVLAWLNLRRTGPPPVTLPPGVGPAP